MRNSSRWCEPTDVDLNWIFVWRLLHKFRRRIVYLHLRRCSRHHRAFPRSHPFHHHLLPHHYQTSAPRSNRNRFEMPFPHTTEHLQFSNRLRAQFPARFLRTNAQRWKRFLCYCMCMCMPHLVFPISLHQLKIVAEIFHAIRRHFFRTFSDRRTRHKFRWHIFRIHFAAIHRWLRSKTCATFKMHLSGIRT